MRLIAATLLGMLAATGFAGEIAADSAAQMLSRVPAGADVRAAEIAAVTRADGETGREPAATPGPAAREAGDEPPAHAADVDVKDVDVSELDTADGNVAEVDVSDLDVANVVAADRDTANGDAADGDLAEVDVSDVEVAEVVAADRDTANGDAADGDAASADIALEAPADKDAAVEPANAVLDEFCSRIDTKLSSVDYDECVRTGLIDSGAVSNDDTPIYYRDFVPAQGEPVARVLLIGGIHGDEYSSVSVVFKWLDILHGDLGEKFHWRIVPVLNPDGLLRPPRMSQRMNANGVDLNRNFPTPNWDVEAHEYWVNRTSRNKRRYPGPAALSEPESAWLAEQIETFAPHAVISVHAPHGVVDFDGPRLPPRHLGPLELRLLGTYPGSMGRYIGIHKGIPILTVELESAFGMPRRGELLDIWDDMLGWLREKIATPMQLAKEASVVPPSPELLRVEADPDNDG